MKGTICRVENIYFLLQDLQYVYWMLAMTSIVFVWIMTGSTIFLNQTNKIDNSFIQPELWGRRQRLTEVYLKFLWWKQFTEKWTTVHYISQKEDWSTIVPIDVDIKSPI